MILASTGARASKLRGRFYFSYAKLKQRAAGASVSQLIPSKMSLCNSCNPDFLWHLNQCLLHCVFSRHSFSIRSAVVSNACAAYLLEMRTCWSCIQSPQAQHPDHQTMQLNANHSTCNTCCIPGISSIFYCSCHWALVSLLDGKSPFETCDYGWFQVEHINAQCLEH